MHRWETPTGWFYSMSKRKIWQEGDENVCSMGYRWALDEDDPLYDNELYALKQKVLETF